MPNWCENDLVIRGLITEVKKFLDFAMGSDMLLDFNKFVPYPEKFRVLDEPSNKWWKDTWLRLKKGENINWGEQPPDGYNSGGYEWCIANWGTKWNACGEKIGVLWESDDEAELTVSFDTPWSPPLPVIKAMGEQFPELTFTLRYFEGGMEFKGILSVRGTEVRRDEVGKYFGGRGG